MSCNTCNQITSLQNSKSDIVQKNIQKQVSVSSSLYSMSLNSLNRNVNNNNVGVKHSCYDRYLSKKKGKLISNSNNNIANIAKIGNKVKSYTISSYNSNCLCDN